MIVNSKLSILANALRSAFIALVPYYILQSAVILISVAISYWNISYGFINTQNINLISGSILSLFPILLIISISYFLALGHSIKRNLSIALSVLIIISAESIVQKLQGSSFSIGQINTFFSIFVPVFSTLLLGALVSIWEKYFDYKKMAIQRQVGIAINYVIPFLLTFMISVVVFISLRLTFSTPAILSEDIASIPDRFMALFQVIFTHAMWYLGIHGSNFFNFLFGGPTFLDQQFVPHLRAITFINLFVVNGGAGAGLSLILAILIGSKDKHTSFIGKVAAPFAIFNINELLIYGIPIFLNRHLIVPFILVPLVNFTISYVVISMGFITFYDVSFSWTTPMFANAYVATNGNMIALLLQLVLTILGTMIYLPYIKKYTRSQSSAGHLQSLSGKLGVMDEIKKNEDVKFQHAQSFLISSHAKVDEIVNLIVDNKLVVFYQPKINVKTNRCDDFESLLRLELQDGRILPPVFMEDLENAGLAYLIDIWVCKQVREDLSTWAEQGFHPNISINLNPYTLQDTKYINEITQILNGFKVDFEIIERSIANNYAVFLENIRKIKRAGMTVSIDDFGAGYSYYGFLYTKMVDHIKLDIHLAKDAMEYNEFSIYSHLSKMCSALDIPIIAEGIETEEEMEKLIKPNDISYVQGYYFSKALQKDDAREFAREFNERQRNTYIDPAN
ncbi:MAG: EAL domain-containing protein [Gammaproteobacteria bacterium]|nr:EAL domain-containing protein [Gammaproteobacteria bacterium]